MARFRHSGELRVHDHTVGIAGDGLHTVLAAQFILIGRFQARDAQHIVHVVALVPQGVGHLAVLVGHLPLFGGDLAHTAQHRRDDIALLVAAGAGLHDFHAGQRQAVLLDGGHGHVADVFRHHKVVHVGKCLQFHLVVDAGQGALPAQRQILQVVFLHQHFHHVVGGGILLQAQVLLHCGQLPLVAAAVIPGCKGIVARRVRLADEQGIGPAFAVFLKQLHQPLQQAVQILVTHLQLVEHHVVAGGRGGNALAGAVHDVAAGSGDRKVIVRRVGGLGLVLVVVDQLQKDQPQGVQAHDQCRHSDQQHHAPHDGLAFVLVHP